MAVRDVPWKFLMRVLRSVRNTFYQKSKPDVDQLVVTNLDHAQLKERLQEHAHFEDAAEYTYKYKGEVVNLRRPEGVEDGYQMVIHIRTFDHEKGTECLCHYEISRFAHPREHLDGTIFKWREGKNRLTEVLNDLDVEYEVLG